jgi:hypothetical protein
MASHDDEIEMDRWIADIIDMNVEPKSKEKMHDVLLRRAYEFLAAGGALSWDNWRALGDYGKGIFTEAANLLRIGVDPTADQDLKTDEDEPKP